MATRDEVSAFLKEFFIKYKVFDILFRDGRPKNADTLLAFDIPPIKRRAVIESLKAEDYSEGPIDDNLYGIAGMWVFGKTFMNTEFYIKISIGHPSSRVICISFHPSQHPMTYPFK